MRVCNDNKTDSTYKHPDVKPGDVVKAVEGYVLNDSGYYFVTAYNELICLTNGERWSSDGLFGVGDTVRWEKVYCCFREDK